MAHPYGPEWAAASDADRNHAVATIQAAQITGRISGDNAARRYDAVSRASTRTDLEEIVGDLGIAPPGPPPGAVPPATPTAPAPYPYSGYPIYPAPAAYPPAPGYPPGIGYPTVPGWQPPPPAPSPEPTAIGALIAGLAGYLFFIGPLAWTPGVVLGHVAVRRLRTRARPGRGMAIAGLTLSWIGMAITAAGVIAILLNSGS